MNNVKTIENILTSEDIDLILNHSIVKFNKNLLEKEETNKKILNFLW
jgi:hypothetical protein